MASKTKNDVFGRLFAHRDELKRFGVKKCGLFGSYIRNQQSRRSDIDILVEFEPEYKTFDNFMNLAFYLEKLLGCDVDLVTKSL